MSANAISIIQGAAVTPSPEFHPANLKVFRSIPSRHHDIVVLRGAVIVYETDTLCREGVQDGAFYVLESQHPAANMQWESWLRRECEDGDKHRRAQPKSPLTTRRKVIQALRCPSGEDRWWHRLPSGFTDGPIHGWSIGHNFVGKVVGIYCPERLEVRQ